MLALPVAMLFPALWASAPTRMVATAVSAGYFLAASRGLPQGAAEFFDFLTQPRQLAMLTALGFRGDAPLPPTTATVTFPSTPEPRPAPENAAAVTINRLVYGG